jgi:hypothetical protein
MTTYSSLNEAYHDPHMEELDQMAKEINNTTKRKNLVKTVADDFKKDAKRSRQIEQRLHNTRGDSNNGINDSNIPFKYFSTQGDFTSEILDEDITTEDINSELQSFPENLTYSDISRQASLGEGSENSSSLPLEIIKNNKHNKNTKSSKHKYADKIKELATEIKKHHENDEKSIDSMDSTIDHIKHCSKCKKKFIDIIVLKKKKHIFNHDDHFVYKHKKEKLRKYKDYDESDNEYKNYDTEENYNKREIEENGKNNSFSLDKLINRTEIKDVLIIILIGIVIIIILDIFNRATRHKY